MSVFIRKELKEQWRTYRFLVVSAVLIVMGLLGPLSVKYMPEILSQIPGVPEELTEVMPEPDVTMAVAEYTENLTLFGLILAILVPMGAVIGEKMKGTATMVLSKPVSRASFLGAKFITYAGVFLVGITLASLTSYYYLGILFEWLAPLGFMALSGLLLIYLTTFVALTLLASTISRSQFAAAGISFGILILLGLLSSIPTLSRYLPSSLIAWGRGLALGIDVGPVWGALVVSVVLIAAAWLGAWLIFRKQEL
ncbi:MAG: ABC transporter permease subunit [Anaerolineales bacterium]|nr:ABC transporter permease subunit [Anaerolineales bacterium]